MLHSQRQDWEERLIQIRDSLQDLQSLDIGQDPAEALLSLIEEIGSVLALLQERISTAVQGQRGL